MFVVRGRAVTPDAGLPLSASPERWLVGITVAAEALIVSIYYNSTARGDCYGALINIRDWNGARASIKV
jgi:hypothetical protein